MTHEVETEFPFTLPAHTLATLTIVFRGELALQSSSGSWETMPGRFAGGSRWRCAKFCASPGSLWVSMITRADTWPILAGRNASHFSNRFFDPAELSASEMSGQYKFIDDKISQRGPDEASALAGELLNFVVDAIGRRPGRPATNLLNAAMAGLRANDLPRVLSDLAVSERRLQRLFQSELGASAKMVERLLRLHRAVSLWEKNSPEVLSLADLALAVGYSDQAHMAHDFRVLVGEPPRELKTSKRTIDQGQDLLWALRHGGRLFLPEIYRPTP